MAGCGASETVTEADGEGRQLSSLKIGRPNRAPCTGGGGGNIIDLEGMSDRFCES
jgi:hypothetical protein